MAQDEMGAKREVLPMKVKIVGVQEKDRDKKTVKVARHWEQKQVGDAARWSTRCGRSSTPPSSRDPLYILRFPLYLANSVAIG